MYCPVLEMLGHCYNGLQSMLRQTWRLSSTIHHRASITFRIHEWCAKLGTTLKLLENAKLGAEAKPSSLEIKFHLCIYREV